MIKRKNAYIVVEGLDGAGKSHLSSRLADYIMTGLKQDLVPVFEPGTTPLCMALRDLIKNKEHRRYESISDLTNLLMFYTARNQLTETVIKPALERGQVVLSDRNRMTSHVYQSEIFDEHPELNCLDKITSLTPDLTIILLRDPSLTKQTEVERGEADTDTFSRDDNFRMKNHLHYLEIAKHKYSHHYGQVITIDCNDFESLAYKSGVLKAFSVVKATIERCIQESNTQLPKEFEDAVFRDLNIKIRIWCDSAQDLPAYIPSENKAGYLSNEREKFEWICNQLPYPVTKLS